LQIELTPSAAGQNGRERICPAESVRRVPVWIVRKHCGERGINPELQCQLCWVKWHV